MRRSYLLAVPALILLWGCEFQSYRDFSIDPYNGAFTFTAITDKADWENRYDHAATAFNGKLWVMGGYNPGEMKGDTYYGDVWSSEDGITWEEISAEAPWKGRRGHALVTFDDGNGEDMYIIGGFEVDEETGYRQYTNDVWRSNNGINWVQIKERTYPPLDSLYDWFPRMHHACVVANHDGTDYIYIIGGRTQLEDHSGVYANKYFNDVWRSTDGINWEKLDNRDYGKRAGHAAAVDPATGRIFIQGGTQGVIVENEMHIAEPVANYYWLWSTTDGINWISENDTANFEQAYLKRTEHQLVFFNNTLWGFPGSTTSQMHYHYAEWYHYPTWRYDEGNLWSVDSEGSDLRGRHSYPAVIFRDKIWFLGGLTSNKGQNNDVWSAEL